jgi:hypothetical protein
VSIGIWRKGYSIHCSLCTTLVCAINRVATAPGCTVFIEKISRRSNTGSIISDELSKGRFTAFKCKLPTDWVIDPVPAWIPPSILYWIAKPEADLYLGNRILRDISKGHK